MRDLWINVNIFETVTNFAEALEDEDSRQIGGENENSFRYEFDVANVACRLCKCTKIGSQSLLRSRFITDNSAIILSPFYHRLRYRCSYILDIIVRPYRNFTRASSLSSFSSIFTSNHQTSNSSIDLVNSYRNNKHAFRQLFPFFAWKRYLVLPLKRKPVSEDQASLSFS